MMSMGPELNIANCATARACPVVAGHPHMYNIPVHTPASDHGMPRQRAASAIPATQKTASFQITGGPPCTTSLATPIRTSTRGGCANGD